VLERECFRDHREKLKERPALLTVSSLLVFAGIAVLTVVIPACSKWFGDNGTKTEFYSVRAAYWCTIVGVGVLGLVLIGGLVQHIMIQVRPGATSTTRTIPTTP
jgi:hypothetical protein